MMIKYTLFLVLLALQSYSLNIINKPIIFNQERIELTKEYISKHYNIQAANIDITPKIIVIHHTGINSLEDSFNKLKEPTLSKDRAYISKSGALNVSAHYMIDTDGTVYSLMPDNHMARHVIGLNYSSIGIENVGGENYEDNLTVEQLKANIELIQFLQNKYNTIQYVIAHYEYQDFVKSTLWLEIDDNYRTIKKDPSIRFMKALRKELQDK